jgi:hypothetical protein
MAMAELKITTDQLNVSGTDTTTIESPELSELIKKDKENAAKLLSAHVTPIDASDLSIDDSGRVTIKNENFAKKLKVADALNICPGDGGIYFG